MTRELPITFTTDNVRAIFEDRKTMTRRLAGLEALNEDPDFVEYLGMRDGLACFHKLRNARGGAAGYRGSHAVKVEGADPNVLFYYKPRYQVGDRLWVRETWQDYCPIWSGAWCGHGSKEGQAKEHGVFYRAGPPHREPILADGVGPLKWRSAMLMPKWAARMWLEVAEVKAERLQEITEEDAKAEGMTIGLAKWQFGEVWDSINPKHPWDANEWVFVYTFRKGGHADETS